MNRKKLILIIILCLSVICALIAVLTLTCKNKQTEPPADDNQKENTETQDPETQNTEENKEPEEPQISDIDIVTEILKKEGIEAKSVTEDDGIVYLVFDTEGESKCTLNDRIFFSKVFDVLYYKIKMNDASRIYVDMVNSDGKVLYHYRTFDLKKFRPKDTNFDSDKAEKEITDLINSEFDYDFESIEINTEYSNKVLVKVKCSPASGSTINKSIEGFFRGYQDVNPALDAYILELHNENGDTISFIMNSFATGDTVGWVSPEVAAGYGPMSPEDY